MFLLIGVSAGIQGAGFAGNDLEASGGDGKALASPTLFDLLKSIGGDTEPLDNQTEDLNETPAVTISSTENGEFARTLETTLGTVTSSFEGAGKEAVSRDITIYDLITDPDLADPHHLGRGKGVKVVIRYNQPLSTLENTLWGYEVDATTVASALYTGDTKNDVGFVAVVFKEATSEEPTIVLRLDAIDASQIGEEWHDITHLRAQDWSAIELGHDSISWYEDPATQTPVRIDHIDSSRTGTAAPEIDKTTLASILYDHTTIFATHVKGLAEISESRNYPRMAYLADEFLQKEYGIEKDVRSLNLPSDLEPVRQEYLLGCMEYAKAGANYWYGASFTDTGQFAEGHTHLDSARDHVNSALSTLNVEGINPDTEVAPSKKMFPDAIRIKERYEYKDPQQVNDISIRIDSCTFKSGYLIEEDGRTEYIRPDFGNKYLYVVVQATHLGFWGGGNERIQTPDPHDFTLITNGMEIKDSTPDRYVKMLGEPYTRTTLERKEKYEGFLLFEVPSSIDLGATYLRLNLGEEGIPVFKLN